ncbi:MAG: hypothetical protein LBK95_13925 [Bifidobacteriaceae bacterium]|nr:hypothetical protein [Bifidobacteriaceae bacterium]
MSEWHVEWTAEARRSLRSIPPRILPSLMDFVWLRLPENPMRATHDLRPPFVGKRSGGVGPYRVIVTVDKDARIVYINRAEYHSRVYRPK